MKKTWPQSHHWPQVSVTVSNDTLMGWNWPGFMQSLNKSGHVFDRLLCALN